MILNVLVAPDPQLKIVARPVTVFDTGLKKLVDDMCETLKHLDGVGLAATQVGVDQRVIVVDADEKNHGVGKPQIFINPEIVTLDDKLSTSAEGCFSVPDFYEDVSRPQGVTIRYHDIDGKIHEISARGLLSTCIQHEIDHLNGILFIDHLSRLKRDRILHKLKKSQR